MQAMAVLGSLTGMVSVISVVQASSVLWQLVARAVSLESAAKEMLVAEANRRGETAVNRHHPPPPAIVPPHNVASQPFACT